MPRELLESLPLTPRIERARIWRRWLGRRLRRVHGAFRLHLPAICHVRPDRWQAVFGCNRALYREDFMHQATICQRIPVAAEGYRQACDADEGAGASNRFAVSA